MRRPATFAITLDTKFDSWNSDGCILSNGEADLVAMTGAVIPTLCDEEQ